MRILRMERKTLWKVAGVSWGVVLFMIMAMILIIILIPETKEQKQERIAEEAEDHRKGFHCLSKTTGRHYGMETMIKEQLKDPGSFDEAETLIAPVNGGQHRIHIEYRAKNSFGAMVVGAAVGLVDTATCKARLLSSG